MTRTFLSILGSLLALNAMAQNDFHQVVFAADTALQTPFSSFVSTSLDDLPINRNIWSAYKTLDDCSGNCSALPLVLLEFRGIRSDRLNVLQWKTTGETNTSHFDVERSVDAQSFTRIGTTGSNNTGGENNYSFIDTETPRGKSYYRLKMVDADGQYSYSKIVVLFQDSSAELTVYPNPARTSVTIVMPDGKYLAQLFAQEGRLAISRNIAISTPAGYTMDVRDLSPGIYTLVMTNLSSTASTAKTLIIAR